MKNPIFLIALLTTGLAVSPKPATPNPDLLVNEWPAKWIAVPGAPHNAYGVYIFRKRIELKTVPSSFVVHVSADNRYKLYVNGKPASFGPARGDLFYWNYETVDLSPWLVPGDNVIAAKVWNEAEYRPEAQISWRTGFILQGDTAAESAVNSNASWKCVRDDSYRPLETSEISGYYVAGPGESIDMKKHVKSWEKAGFDDSSWKNANLAHWRGGSPKGLIDASGWMLVPSTLPQMELSIQRLQSVREAEAIAEPAGFPAQAGEVRIPANAKAVMLLDNGFLTNAYITLNFSRGRDAAISLKYAEALYAPAASASRGPAGKGNRNEVKGKIFLGRKDSLISDGSTGQRFDSLSWRTYRYIQLSVETKGEPLFLEDIFGTFTGYPFQKNSDFTSDRQELGKILEIGWRTARLCAVETYMDCPYYEQLQYIGDARIQALVSLFNSGDDRLVRSALNHMDRSRISEGLTSSRHPSYSPQIIPTFSLWYIGMLHDYWMYGQDGGFVKEKIPGTRQILNFFSNHQQPDGSLKKVPYWNFTDWVDHRGWVRGMAPVGRDGGSAALDLQLLLAYRTAAELEDSLGLQAYAQLYRRNAIGLAQSIRRKYWDPARGLFADTPEKDSFSQHANSLAILAGVSSGKEAAALGKKLLENGSLAPASIYFKYYLHLALIKAGLGNDYLNWLDKWRQNIQMGLTTWAEKQDIDTSRSDCHAWGSSPNIELYRTVLGIDAGAPGFARVRIEPHLGALRKVGGEIPHPKGKIRVQYEWVRGKWKIAIQLPAGLSGTFIWKNRPYALKAGDSKMEL